MSSAEDANRILVIDDDRELCELLTEYLAAEGFHITTVHQGLEGVEQSLNGEYNLVVLDVMLPQINGFEVLRRIRSCSSIPVLMLTARGDDIDRIIGLELGADDYLPKPFNPRELAARIQAILRRTRAPQSAAPQLKRRVVEDIVLDTGARAVMLNGQPVDLTTVEFDLLHCFLQAPGAVLQREYLVKKVLGREFSPFDRSIDMHVSNLRKKLGPRADGEDRIKAIRGAGYLLTCSVPTS